MGSRMNVHSSQRKNFHHCVRKSGVWCLVPGCTFQTESTPHCRQSGVLSNVPFLPQPNNFQNRIPGCAAIGSLNTAIESIPAQPSHGGYRAMVRVQIIAESKGFTTATFCCPLHFFYTGRKGAVIFVVMSQLITNIRQLVNVRRESHVLRGKELAELPIIENAYLRVDRGAISDYGEMSSLPMDTSSENTMDAQGATVLPCWCDSHTHLVFAASREEEFVDKLKGLSYAEIAAKGGGILNSAQKLSECPEEMLYTQARERLQQLMKLGTGAIEIKSGYGLSVEAELKMLRVIKKIKEHSPIPVRATFLGAHAYPAAYKNDHGAYLKLIIEQMLPVIQSEKLADYIDVFCEDGFFSVEETEIICRAGMAVGLQPKIHANQLNLSGGVQVGVKMGALSVDHLETMDSDAIELLAKSQTIGTLLPTAAFFLRMPFQPARALIDAGCAIALASDYNPGSSPSGNMNLVVSMSCIQMKMLPEEAINAATINGAYAMGLGDKFGSITLGKKANLVFTKPIPSLAYLPYAFGSDLIDKVMINGDFI